MDDRFSPLIAFGVAGDPTRALAAKPSTHPPTSGDRRPYDDVGLLSIRPIFIIRIVYLFIFFLGGGGGVYFGYITDFFLQGLLGGFTFFLRLVFCFFLNLLSLSYRNTDCSGKPFHGPSPFFSMQVRPKDALTWTGPSGPRRLVPGLHRISSSSSSPKGSPYRPEPFASSEPPPASEPAPRPRHLPGCRES